MHRPARGYASESPRWAIFQEALAQDRPCRPCRSIGQYFRHVESHDFYRGMFPGYRATGNTIDGVLILCQSEPPLRLKPIEEATGRRLASGRLSISFAGQRRHRAAKAGLLHAGAGRPRQGLLIPFRPRCSVCLPWKCRPRTGLRTPGCRLSNERNRRSMLWDGSRNPVCLFGKYMFFAVTISTQDVRHI